MKKNEKKQFWQNLAGYKKAFLLGLAAVLLGLFASCSSGGSGSDGESYSIDENLAPVADGYFRINTLATKADNVWIWNDFSDAAKDGNGSWSDAGSGYRAKTGKNGDYVYFDIPLAENPESLGFIVRSGTSKVSGDADILFYFPNRYNTIYLKNGSGTVYVDKDCQQTPSGLVSAEISDEKKIALSLSGSVKASKENISVKSGDTALTITSVSETTVEVQESLKELSGVCVTYTDSDGKDVRYASFASTLIDSWFTLTDADIASLGYNSSTHVFTTWAPLASSVTVILFENAASAVSGDSYKEAGTVAMVRQSNGTWKSADAQSTVGSNKYYKYRIVNNGVTKDVCDIWAKVASKDSVATAIEGIGTWSEESNYQNPFTGEAYSGAVIYEMHITDWAQALRTNVEEDKPGTFSEITAGLASNQKLAEHLKDIGVTHVQILPMFEYAVTTKRSDNNTKVETNDNAYNWGYNPYNYNTPESRYAALTDSSDGSEAVTALRGMIKAFHDAGLAVIMDVVYNHTNGTGDGSIYDMTVPKYFYRTSGSNYVDNSGCGNTLDTTHKAVEQFIIDSMKHWMNDYHINGFRFDLMGCLTKDTMKNIYDELYKIDNKVMIYGEPWTGSGTVPNGATSAGSGTTGLGYGAFDDDYRDAIKGAEFGGFKTGQVQGTFDDKAIITGLLGNSGSNKRNETKKPELSLHYVECHDNYTLFDKLVYSTTGGLTGDFASRFAALYDAVIKNTTTLEQIKKQDTLAAAFVLLAQGTPFLNGGQEFLRTKQGDPDSYAADNKGGVFWENIDAVNAINLQFKETYADVYKTYKGLIALRKANATAFGANTSAAAETYNNTKGVIKYTTGDFCVYFNATAAAVNITTTDYTKVINVTSGEPKEETSLPTTVAAKSFVILEK